MFKYIDQSRTLARILEYFSNALAKRRGLPIVIGIILVGLAFALQVTNVYASNQLVELLGVILHHMGILIALIGILLAIPLGK